MQRQRIKLQGGLRKQMLRSYRPRGWHLTPYYSAQGRIKNQLHHERWVQCLNWCKHNLPQRFHPGSPGAQEGNRNSNNSVVPQSCLTLCNPTDCSPPGSSVHEILQARILEWIAIPFLQRIFQTQGSNLGLLHCRQILYRLSHREDKDQIFTEPEPERVIVTSHKNWGTLK